MASGPQVAPSRATESKLAKMPDGFFLHYTDTGTSDLPAIIMLHGAGSHGTKVYANEGHVEGLRSICRVIVVDWRGHGESCHIPAGTLTLATCADDLHELMKILGLSPSKTIMYGMSMGWSIVLTYLRKYGTDVKALICEDMIPAYPPDKAAAEGYQGFFGPEMAGQMKDILFTDRWTGMGGFKPFIFGAPGLVSEDLVASKWAACLDDFSLVSPDSWLSIMNELGAYDCIDVLPSIKAAKLPGLVMSGKSQFNPADKVKQAETMGAKIIHYEHSAHFVHMTEPVKFLADMVEFIKGL